MKILTAFGSKRLCKSACDTAKHRDEARAVKRFATNYRRVAERLRKDVDAWKLQTQAIKEGKELNRSARHVLLLINFPRRASGLA